MEIDSQRTGSVLVLAPRGRIDSATSRDLECAVTAAFDGGDSAFVIDMAGVDYISSLGLGVLLKGAKRAQAGSGHIELCALQAPVRHVFEISGFDRILGIHASRDQAVEAVTAAAPRATGGGGGGGGGGAGGPTC
jgi:anti-anti-sigma factor